MKGSGKAARGRSSGREGKGECLNARPSDVFTRRSNWGCSSSVVTRHYKAEGVAGMTGESADGKACCTEACASEETRSWDAEQKHVTPSTLTHPGWHSP